MRNKLPLSTRNVQDENELKIVSKAILSGVSFV
jgi:hypothetical protein